MLCPKSCAALVYVALRNVNVAVQSMGVDRGIAGRCLALRWRWLRASW
jgi:hypothetical protein